MPKSTPNKPVSGLTYEAALEELEAIVTRLEGEQHPLEDAMVLYERGQALVKHCGKLLDKAELKVKQLSGDELVDFEQD